MKSRQCIAALMLVGSSLFAIPAAQALELYGGAGGVGTKFSGEGCNAASGNASFSGDCDRDSSGYKIFAGFQLLPFTAIEVGYVDFGKVEANGILSGTSRNLNMEANAIYVAGVLRATVLDRVTLFGKLGAQRWDAKGNLGSSSVGTQQSEDGYNVMYGLGVSIRIIGPLGIFGEVERFENVGEADTTGRASIDVYSLGLVVRF